MVIACPVPEVGGFSNFRAPKMNPVGLKSRGGQGT